MVTTISEITYINSVTSTTFTFLPAERLEVEAQERAKGRSTLILFTNPGSANFFHGIVGKDDSGNPMILDTDLVAKPCPPFCGEKGKAYAVAYP